MSPSSPHLDPDTRARLILLRLDQMGPARLQWLLAGTEAPAVLDALRRGRLPLGGDAAPPGVHRSLVERWHHDLADIEDGVDGIVAAGRELGVRILSPADPAWPFTDDPEPPGLLFARGDLDLLAPDTAVAVVGTRRCTALGRTVAYGLGRDLVSADAVVVSGLALGVDGAAHRGALDHGRAVVGVVAGGLDVVYPRANRALWDEVADRGLLLSETPLGLRPDRWRFPARNRLIAALSDGVIVVESHERGGALSTADEAIRRDLPVMAVPGSVTSAASRGTNALLLDGAVPVRDALDVLAYLGRPLPGSVTGGGGDGRAADAAHRGDDTRSEVGRVPGPSAAPPPGSMAARILAEVATGPIHLDDLVAVVERSVADVLAAVQDLQAQGLVELEGSTVSHPRPGPS